MRRRRLTPSPAAVRRHEGRATQRILLLTLALATSLASAQTPAPPVETGPILILGDSIMAWNDDVGASVAHRLRARTGADVTSHAIPGSRILERADAIPKQYRPGPWRWVLVQGGGNDLVEDCACGACTDVLDQLLGPDGTTGAIADLVTRILREDANVLLWSYYEPLPTAPYPFDRCSDALQHVHERLTRLAATSDRIQLLDGRDVMDPSKPNAYDRDGVHPSPLGSDAIALQIARILDKSQE